MKESLCWSFSVNCAACSEVTIHKQSFIIISSLNRKTLLVCFPVITDVLSREIKKENFLPQKSSAQEILGKTCLLCNCSLVGPFLFVSHTLWKRQEVSEYVLQQPEKSLDWNHKCWCLKCKNYDYMAGTSLAHRVVGEVKSRSVWRWLWETQLRCFCNWTPSGRTLIGPTGLHNSNTSLKKSFSFTVGGMSDRNTFSFTFLLNM